MAYGRVWNQRLQVEKRHAMPRIITTYFRRGARRVARFWRARRGSTAVEFALVAPAFLGLLIAIFETTLFLFAQATLQNAAVEAGRLFMTGQAQNAGTTQAQFESDICPMISALFTCSNLMVNVSAYTNFSSANASAPTLTYNSGGSVTNSWSYAAGTPGQVMVVQLIYQWPIVSGPFGYVLSNLGNGKTEIMGVTAFRVEPY
jgi:Flp pilus assembly protein TadG